MSDDFDKWVSQISEWQDQVASVPAMARNHIQKSRMKPAMPGQQAQSLLYDPLAVQYAMGYKDRKYSLTYDFLKRIPHQLSVVGAILQTRCNQVASFSVPFRTSKSVGFVIKHKDPSHLTTKSEQKFIKELETFIYKCGQSEPNPHAEYKRDDFETFLKKIVRDSLMYDQATFEVVPDRRGIPYEFMAVDAATMRIAASNAVFGPNDTFYARSGSYTGQDNANYPGGPYTSLKLYKKPYTKPKEADFVQVINGQIATVYNHDELAFGIRNPRTDIYIQGYGYGELEQLVTIVTAHLYAEEYNRRFFMQGSAPKGILNFKGDTMTPDMLEHFKRQWRAGLEGVENSWKTPILQSEQGVDWIDLHPSNREMEYNAWIEYLLKVTCFTENTPVTLADGSLKRIADIAPGDCVRTHTGAAFPVKNLQVSSHDGKLYHIRAGETIEVTSEHPLYVASSELTQGVREMSEPGWKEAKDVVEGVDYLCIPKKGYACGNVDEIDITAYLEPGTYKLSSDGTKVAPNANRVTWISRFIPLTPENSFVLGLYMSEGNTTDSAAFFTFSKDEEAYVDLVAEFALRMGCHSKPYKAKNSVANIRVHSGVLAKFLSEAFGSTAKQKRVPLELMTGTELAQQSFFSGVFAGDGSVPDFASGEKTATLSLVSHAGIEQLRSMLLAQDIYSHPYTVVSSGFRSAAKKSNIRRMDVNGAQARKLAKWLIGPKGDSLRLRVESPSNHGDKVYENSSYFFVPVSEVWTEEFSGNVYNIEVAEEHTYQAHRFAVHNCAVFLIDPAELNFDMHGGVQQTPLFESSQEWKLKASRDRGLKPMLRFIAKMINEHIISKIDDHFVFDFVGLDELTEQEKHTLRTEQVNSYRTLNEIRREDDLPDLEHGDIPMNPVYLQAIQIKQQQEQQEMQAQQTDQAPAGDQAAPDPEDPEEDPSPEYSDSFGKSITRELQIDGLDEWLSGLEDYDV